MKTLRQHLQQLCKQKIDESIAAARQSLEQTRAAQQEETKGSAGDKFETTREMMTQEIEKASSAIVKLSEEKSRLASLPLREANGFVQPGSVVFTNRAKFYVSMGRGSIVYDGAAFQTISPYSRIGRLMLNKKKGNRFTFNGIEYLVEAIF